MAGALPFPAPQAALGRPNGDRRRAARLTNHLDRLADLKKGPKRQVVRLLAIDSADRATLTRIMK
jgi:hypothetical protein